MAAAAPPVASGSRPAAEMAPKLTRSPVAHGPGHTGHQRSGVSRGCAHAPMLGRARPAGHLLGRQGSAGSPTRDGSHFSGCHSEVSASVREVLWEDHPHVPRRPHPESHLRSLTTSVPVHWRGADTHVYTVRSCSRDEVGRVLEANPEGCDTQTKINKASEFTKGNLCSRIKGQRG